MAAGQQIAFRPNEMVMHRLAMSATGPTAFPEDWNNARAKASSLDKGGSKEGAAARMGCYKGSAGSP